MSLKWRVDQVGRTAFIGVVLSDEREYQCCNSVHRKSRAAERCARRTMRVLAR